ncbi:multidrug efflux RND transporter permease subunit [Flavisphingomonas formosensis]|uniref:multidrug efflux RND transporter permease subunit n=1 Tax=Flavisphingomonas formosensis TaxID=861534 RepID=UPI0022B767F1|nr:multidrug efflux RND transporter permease subunit [Sphingomonas formosensis]
MIPRFFIDRPVFAWVIALGIALAGAIALRGLSVEQYPNIAPPSLMINLTYQGADAETLEQNATQVIEQELNGIEGFLYMSSTSQANGTASITVTFKAGTDINFAQVEVQNRLSRVEPRLPAEVRQQGIQVVQANSGFLMVVFISSKSGLTGPTELGNIANAQLIDELRRVPGVGDIRLLGSQYAMRIWLDPEKLASYKLSAADALAAVQEQNSQTAGGQIGDLPQANGIEINATVATQNRFTNPEQFRQIILRANPDGSTVKLGDVARVELGADSYITSGELNGKPGVGMAIQTTNGANALATAEGVKKRMAELQKQLPADVTWAAPYDSTPFISASVHEVVKTLIEAMFLVFLVMLLFLQNLRATLIPTLVVPIALLGACLGLALFGFTINVLTLFGMVLAIGILVDDAIVVIENVERIMAEEGLAPREATIKAMDQITSAIIGITLVLIAVFLPMAFFPGSTGGIYRQFSVTLAISIGFSALLALTLTPALCAAFLKPHAKPAEEGGHEVAETASAPGWRGALGRGFNRFNGWFGRTTDRYQARVGGMLKAPVRWLVVFLLLVGLTGLLFSRVPGGFLPDEDQGYLISILQGPPGATQARMDKAAQQAVDYYRSLPQVTRVVRFRGFSFFGQGQSAGIIFTMFKPWDERHGKENAASTILGKAFARMMQIKESMVFVINPPAIRELGTASGFSFRLEDRTGQGQQALVGARNQLLGLAAQSKVLAGVRPEGLEDAPQLKVEIDRVRARALGLAIGDVNNTLAIAFGSAYANDFNNSGRVLRVLIQADAAYRMTPQDLLDLRVRNSSGEMVPFSAFTKAEWISGSQQRQRYNGYPAMSISGTAAPGYSTGQAIAEMERLFNQLPPGFSFEWTGLSYEEIQAAGQVAALLGLSLIVVFLVLAALYESWTVPVAVLLVVPLGVLGAVLFTMLRGLNADIYFNVGLIAIIGLAAKNAILIIEFAIEEEEAGKSVVEATLSAVKLRLRPIIMTSLAFILGMMPLVFATGAGAASRRAVGSGVMGGMITATVLGIFFIPVFYLAVRRWVTRKAPHSAGHGEGGEPQEPAHD